MLACDEEARDRPDLLIVDRVENPRMLELWIFLAGRKSAPADRLRVRVGEEPRRRSLLHPPPKRAAILGSPSPGKSASPEPPEHAPAAATNAVRLEQPLEIVPAPRGQRFDDEPARPHTRTLTRNDTQASSERYRGAPVSSALRLKRSR